MEKIQDKTLIVFWSNPWTIKNYKIHDGWWLHVDCSSHDDIEDDEDIEIISDYTNDCNYCDTTCETQSDLIVHMSNIHMDQFPHIQQKSDLIVKTRTQPSAQFNWVWG